MAEVVGAAVRILGPVAEGVAIAECAENGDTAKTGGVKLID